MFRFLKAKNSFYALKKRQNTTGKINGYKMKLMKIRCRGQIRTAV